MTLHKRDNMGFQIAPSLIIFLVILGSGFLVCCGFAIFRFYGDEPDQHKWQKRTPEQDEYMRSVRERNWNKLPRIAGRNLHAYSNQDISHAPMTPR
jgi:hypothetical protein